MLARHGKILLEWSSQPHLRYDFRSMSLHKEHRTPTYIKRAYGPPYCGQTFLLEQEQST